MNFEVFDAKKIEQYKTEVKSKWGNSKAYQEYEQRAVSHSEHNYHNLLVVADLKLSRCLAVT